MELGNDVSGQPVTGQGDTGQPATGQGVAVQPAPGQDAQPQLVTEEQAVPYARFKEVNDGAKVAKDALAVAEAKAAQYEAILANQARPQQAAQQPQQDPFEAFIEREQIAKDGYVTPDDLKKIAAFNRQMVQQENVQAQQSTWLAGHPDFQSVVYAPGGGPSQHLLKAIQSDPALGMSLSRYWDPVIAYNVAKGAMQQVTSTPTPQPLVNPLDAIRNGQKSPQGISAAVGGGGTNDLATWAKGATDDQIREYLAKRRGQSL